MRLSKSFIPTVKELPADAVIPSHQLMIRAGLIRQLGAGIFSMLPLGYIVMKKVMEIIREEMDAIGGQEFHLPALNPIELWEETGRVETLGDILFQVKNRNLVLAPTHEEVITQIAKNHIQSYKEMPQIWYQIQTKFRNEPRPKSGVLRGRQFTMKDSYSLDSTLNGLDKNYNLHYDAYKKIYDRCGLKYFIVSASSGAMGGSSSQEFMVQSNAGEDTLATCESCGYAANLEIATSKTELIERNKISDEIKNIHTPNVKTIDQLAEFLKVQTTNCAKSLVYFNGKTPILILMEGNDQLNESKLQSIFGSDVRPAHEEELINLTGADAGSIGPVNLKSDLKIIADLKLQNRNGLICGANTNDYHIINVDMNRDAKVENFYDLRIVEENERCFCGNGKIKIIKGIEVGHIFKLGTKYSTSLKANFLDENGIEKPIIMGSYGIGVERIMACHLEQNHDEKGITWRNSLAPYLIHLICVSTKSENVVNESEKIYNELISKNYSVLFDDRSDVTPGFKFNDADLLGMPLQIIIGAKNLNDNLIEFKNRKTGERWTSKKENLMTEILKYFKNE